MRICDIIRSVLGFLRGTGTNQVGETVVVGFQTSGFGLNEVTETTPTDGDIIGVRLDIKIVVNSILEISVIDPNILGIVQTKQIPSVAVVSSRTFEG